MSIHLAPRHFVEAIDGTLAPAVQAHLRECETCRAELDRLGTLLGEVETGLPVPEPSPLFWDHLAERVRQATAAAVPSSPSWWPGWRPVLIAGAFVGVVALAVVVRPVPQGPALDAVVADVDLPALPAIDEEAWDLVVSFTDDLTWDEVQRAAAPRAGSADAMIGALSAAERAELVKLLKKEMGGLE